MEGKIGSPEKPLSDLGLISYRAYWKDIILNYLCNYPDREINFKAISEEMGIQTYDIVSTLQYLGMIVTTTVSPASATKGDTISITGSNLGGATKVLVGSTECVISAQTSTTISCALGFNVGGFDYPIKVVTSDS